MQSEIQKEALSKIQNTTLRNYKSKPLSLSNKTHKIIKAVIKDFPTFLKILTRKEEKNKIYVAVEAGGGMGDMLRCSALVKKLALLYPSMHFDIYANNKILGHFIFGSIERIENIALEYLMPLFSGKYDIVYKCLQITEPAFYNLNNDIIKDLKTVSDTQKDIFDLYYRHKDNAFGLIAEKAANKGQNFMDILGLTAGVKDLSEQDISLDIKEPNPLEGKKYITISTGWNPRDYIKNGIPTKVWPPAYWQEFAAMFKQANPDIEIVQLGQNNAPIIKDVNNYFVGKLSLDKSSAILNGSFLHIDCDGGLVHIARVLGVKTVVLFGPSNGRYVGYKENINLFSPFCGNCWHTMPGWNKKCALGYGAAKCMESINPKIVLECVLSVLCGTSLKI
ncbi:MAG: hypothetical protein LBQ47_04955 [Endomicrobium sp.]|jgi:ADP-heptose:LPS heptosyltransferase|nr:hypothetical protein [Endomicrobium sp.]